MLRAVFALIFVLGVIGSTPVTDDLKTGTTSKPSRSIQWCQYRDIPVRYNAEVFRLQSSFGCYIYNPDSKFSIVYNKTTTSVNGMPYQCLSINGSKVNVDYLSDESTAFVAQSFKSQKDTEKWKECSKAAEECCQNMLDTPNIGEGCPATWDAWSCWPEAGNGTWNQDVCPGYIYSGSAPTCNHFSSKECGDGEWNVNTDYSTCDITKRLKARIRFHVAVLGVSLCVALPAIVIFFAYRKLRTSMRVILHRNLLLAISARNICTIISKSVILWDALVAKNEESSLMYQNGVACRVLAVLEKLAGNAVFVCMLLLGVFLHRLIAKAFRGEPHMFWYFLGSAATTCLPVLAWSVATAVLYDSNCWTIDTGGLQWINDSVRILLLAVNFFLILDIIRVLVTKLRKVNTGNSQNIRRTIKATVWLVPVFGVQFIFTAVRPKTTDCLSEQIFYFFSYGLDGIQGAVVALLFCYFNKEVQILLKKSIISTRDKIRTRLDPNYTSPGFESGRHTNTTTADPQRRSSTSNLSHLDTTCVRPTRKINKVDPWKDQDIFLTPRSSICSGKEDFYTPRNSMTSVSGFGSGVFYSPRSSVSGGSGWDNQFFDCFDQELDLKVGSSQGSTDGDLVVFGNSGETVA